MRDTPNGKDRFDAEVKQVMRSWSLLKPTGADYVMVARLVAARHNMHDGELELPAVSSAAEGDCTARLAMEHRTTDAWFEECYPPQLEELDELYYRTMTTTAKLVAPANTDDCSPFRSLLPQMPEDSAARQYERLAIKHDQVRVAGQAPVAVDEDNDDVDSDADMLDETLSVVDEGAIGGPSSLINAQYYRISRIARELGSVTSMGAGAEEDSVLLRAPRVVLAPPRPEAVSAFRWHVQPWLLARRLLDRTNDQSASVAAAAAAAAVAATASAETAEGMAGAAAAQPPPPSHFLFRPAVPHTVSSTAGASAPASGAPEFVAPQRAPPVAEAPRDGPQSPASAPVLDLDPDVGSDSESDVAALPTLLSAPAGTLSPISSLMGRLSPEHDDGEGRQPSPPPPIASAPAPEGFPGDGWPELRERGGEPGARLLRTSAQLVTPLPTAAGQAAEADMVVYRRMANMPRLALQAPTAGQPALSTDHEVIHTYLARAEGRLARAARLANAAVGLPIRPLA